MGTRNRNDGFRRILYDAMVLSASLRAIRECGYYRRATAKKIDGAVEAHQANALIQIRSMIDFLTCSCTHYPDTMTVVQFYGCRKQSIPFAEKKATNKYAAHKSWDAVAKDASAGARQLKKPEIVKLGRTVFDAFAKFWKECDTHSPLAWNAYAHRYKAILEDNLKKLDQLGP